MENSKEFNEFIQGWTSDSLGMKAVFEDYRKFLASQPDTTLDFKPRPGISYSLRARNGAQKARGLFTLIDVVDDNPDERWLSVCFYADMIEDPDELGDFVPNGLLGEDAICFNLDEDNEDLKQYIFERLKEASRNAAAS